MLSLRPSNCLPEHSRLGLRESQFLTECHVIGQTIAHYTITEKIGQGGMGEVYRAADSVLKRDIALKFLPESMAQDETARRRFLREARSAAALDHPFICQIHEIGEIDGVDFIAMEYVSGQTLKEKLAEGLLPVPECLRIASEIAEALDKAQEKGIVHRDLKPANIMLTSDGHVKLMDFGLAKRASGAQEDTQQVSVTKLTQEGATLGTVPYMSPEHLKGEAVDSRSDIFSFGIILYEMLAGVHPFIKPDVMATASSILQEEPPPLVLHREGISPVIQYMVRKMLAKESEKRYQWVRELHTDLVALQQDPDPAAVLAGQIQIPVAGVAPSAPIRSQWQAAASWLLTVVLLAAIVVLWIFTRGDVPDQARAVFSVLPPEGATIRAVAVSPDGEQLVFVAEEPSGSYLWLRRLDSQVLRRLQGTSGAIDPFWSPDGRYVGFFADGKLKKMEVPGGPVEELADASFPRGGTWNRDGIIVFPSHGPPGLYRIAASGGQPVRMISLDVLSGENSHRYPSFLPDGRHVLYFARNPVNPEFTGVWVASLEGETRQILNVNSLAMYAPPGYLLYRRGRNLLAHPFDAGTLSFTAEPVSIADDVGYDPAFSRLVKFSVSETGLLAYEGGGIEKSELLWFDRRGELIGSVGTPANYLNLYLSSDDRKLAVSRTNERTDTRDLWQYDLDSDREYPFTVNPASDFSPLWSPDDTEIIFSSSRAGRYDIYSQPAAGGTEAELLWETEGTKLVRDWSADGRFVVFEDMQANVDLWILDLESTQAAPFRETEYHEYFGRLSTDMRWIAYSSNATGIFEVWVERFPVSGEPWLVSSGGGFQPIWHPDGRELFYISPDGKLMSVEIVRSDTTFVTAAPIELFPTRVSMATVNPPDSLNHYDVGADAERFLIASQPEATRTIVVVANWDAPLGR